MNSCPDERSIRWENVSFSFGENAKRNTLEHINLSVNADQFTVITGPSGCGKSTLLYLAAGIYPANGGFMHSGKVTVNGMEPGSIPPEERSSLLCMMFQNPDLQFCMDTVEHELVFCMENISLPVKDMETRLSDALEFCGISHLRRRQFISLSGGEKQRVMLACAMVLRPRWLLLDEPFANIDEDSASILVDKLCQLHREFGVGIVAVDHNPWLWRGAADNLVVLSASGIPSRTETDLNRADSDLLVSLGVICPAVPYQAEKPQKKACGTFAIDVKDLTVRKDGHTILNGLSARFEAGKIHAILGPSGCGKSTLFSTFCGMEKYEGSILVNGRELRCIKKKKLGGIAGFVFQNPQDQFVADTVLEEIAFSLRAGNSADVDADAKRVLQEIGLWRHRNLSPYMLSQGQQRRLGTSALLAYPCDILICDEPTYAQDRANVLVIMDELQRRVTEDGLTLIFSTHDTLLAESYADQIYHMREGIL